MLKLFCLLLLHNTGFCSQPAAKPSQAQDAKMEKDTKNNDATNHKPIRLISGDKQATYELPYALAKNPHVSKLLATSLEDDDRTEEIPLPSVTATALKKIGPLLTFIGAQKGWGATLSAEEKKSYLEVLTKQFGNITEAEFPELITAVNFLDSQALLHAILWRYATLLHSKSEDHKKRNVPFNMLQQIQNDKVTNVLWPDISRYYFLQFDEDIDAIFDQPGKPPVRNLIDFDTLKAYKKFPSLLLKYFPNLKTDPYERNTTNFKDLKTIDALLWTYKYGLGTQAIFKLKGFIIPREDLVLVYYKIATSSHGMSPEAFLDACIRAGADIDLWIHNKEIGLPTNPLHAAALKSLEPEIRALLARGASTTTLPEATPLLWGPAMAMEVSIIELLMRHSNNVILNDLIQYNDNLIKANPSKIFRTNHTLDQNDIENLKLILEQIIKENQEGLDAKAREKKALTQP
jgi:hypothetical protein